MKIERLQEGYPINPESHSDYGLNVSTGDEYLN